MAQFFNSAPLVKEMLGRAPKRSKRPPFPSEHRYDALVGQELQMMEYLQGFWKYGLRAKMQPAFDGTYGSVMGVVADELDACVNLIVRTLIDHTHPGLEILLANRAMSNIDYESGVASFEAMYVGAAERLGQVMENVASKVVAELAPSIATLTPHRA